MIKKDKPINNLINKRNTIQEFHNKINKNKSYNTFKHYNPKSRYEFNNLKKYYIFGYHNNNKNNIYYKQCIKKILKEDTLFVSKNK